MTDERGPNLRMDATEELAERERLITRGGWLPINTAPRDDTIIQVLCGDEYQTVDIAKYDEDRRCAGEGPGSHFGPGWRSAESGLGILWEFEPTHWRPMDPLLASRIQSAAARHGIKIADGIALAIAGELEGRG